MHSKKRTLTILAGLIAFQAAVHAADTINYEFDDGTLQGWFNNVPTGTSGENYVPLDSALNSYSGRTVARSPDFMVLEADFDDRDGSDTLVKVISSPELSLTDTSSVSAWTLGGVGGTTTPTWSNYADLPTAATSGDFMGIALRRVSDGEYLLFSNRSGNGQSNRTINWIELGWDSTEISGAISGDSPAETYQIDLIDAFSGGWGWIGMDDVRVDGLPDSNFAITHIAYDPTTGLGGDGEFTLTWNSLEGTTYGIYYSRDMTDWSANVNDAYPAEIGDTTTITFDHPDPGADRTFFRVEKRN